MVCTFPFKTQLRLKRCWNVDVFFHVCRWNSKQLEICCGTLLTLSCYPSLRINTRFTPIRSFFHMAESAWQEFSETARDLWPGTLNSDWAKFTVDLIQCVSPDLHRMCWPVPGHAAWINYTLLKVAQGGAGSKERSERRRCFWFPLQRIRETDLIVNYESNPWPSSFPREGACWLNEP